MILKTNTTTTTHMTTTRITTQRYIKFEARWTLAFNVITQRHTKTTMLINNDGNVNIHTVSN